MSTPSQGSDRISARLSWAILALGGLAGAGALRFLQKPYSGDALERTVRAALDARVQPSSSSASSSAATTS